MKIKIVNTSHHPLPEYATPMSAGVDLRANLSAPLKLQPMQRCLVPTGLRIALPQGYEAHLAPRSSTFKNYGILQTNSVGVVDCSYCGDNDQWHMPVYATRDVTIEKGARICQFRIMENQPKLLFTRVEHLESPDRGGFGSTGK